MDPITLGFISTMLGLIVKYGIPGAIRIINEWAGDKDEITVEDIRELRDKMKHPDDYYDWDPGE